MIVGRTDTQPIGSPKGTDPIAAAPQAGVARPAARTDVMKRSPEWQADFKDERHRIAAMIGAIASAHSRGAEYQPPTINQSPISGGAPALEPEQMSPAVVNSSPTLKVLYSGLVQNKAPWLLDVYQYATRLTGPIGAFVNLGFNLWNAKKIFSDPKTPVFVKGGIAASTALAGVSAATATRLSLAAFKVLPMADTAMRAMGNVAGIAGLGAGTILAGLNVYNTFHNPKATDAAKGFSVATLTGSTALTIVTAMAAAGSIAPGVGTVLGVGLGILTVGTMFAQSFLAHNKIANEVFKAVGDGVSTAAKAVGGAVEGAARSVGHLASSVGHDIASVFSGW